MYLYSPQTNLLGVSCCFAHVSLWVLSSFLSQNIGIHLSGVRRPGVHIPPAKTWAPKPRFTKPGSWDQICLKKTWGPPNPGPPSFPEKTWGPWTPGTGVNLGVAITLNRGSPSKRQHSSLKKEGFFQT